MTQNLKTAPITQEAVQGLAEVIELKDTADKFINQGKCGRFHDLAKVDVEGASGISLFQSELFSLPFKMEMMERHPHGSQAFLPMSDADFLVVVAEDVDGKPSNPRAFVASNGQGVNIGKNVWHGVLCPQSGNGLFAVIDRVADGPNLEEHWFKTPILVE